MKIIKQQIINNLKCIIGDEPIFYIKHTRQKDWAEDLSNGRFFMNTVQYYRDLEEKTLKKGQGDKFELKEHLDVINIDIINKTTNNTCLTIPSAKFSLEINGDCDAYLFCMTGLTFDDFEIIEYNDTTARVKFKFTPEYIKHIKEDFGEYLVIITGLDFRKYITNNTCGSGIPCVFGKVLYRKKNDFERLNAFNTFSPTRFLYKDLDFIDQREYRFAIPNKYIKNNFLNLEPINNISSICKIDDLLDYEILIHYELSEI